MFDGRLRNGVDRCTAPVGEVLGKSGISPNALTVGGVVFAVAAGAEIAMGHLGIGLVLQVLCGLPDLLDGPLAKATGKMSPRGAYLDSVSDRISDSALLVGVAWYLSNSKSPHDAFLAIGVLAISMVISYQRAKAESLGVRAKGGLMERAERFLALLFGVAFSSLLVPVLWVILLLSSITAIQRFAKVWSGLSIDSTDREAMPTSVRNRGDLPATSRAELTKENHLARFRPRPRVESRWRVWREGAAARRGTERNEPVAVFATWRARHGGFFAGRQARRRDDSLAGSRRATPAYRRLSSRQKNH